MSAPFAALPVAWCRVEENGSCRQLLVVDCPFCRRSHRYGAGTPEEPLEAFLGVRVAACAPFTDRSYLLRPVSQRGTPV